MAARYEVKWVDMGTGERMPLLTKDGVGVFESTAFALAMRTKGLQVSTLDRALRAVQFLYESLSEAGVDLMERAKLNDLLTLGEVEGLVARSKFAKKGLASVCAEANSANVAALRAPLSKNKVQHYGSPKVEGNTSAGRLYYIAAYLVWFADYVYLLNIPQNRNEFRGTAAIVVASIRARISKSSKNKRSRRGITKDQELLLLSVVALDSPENLWKSTFIRLRNFIVVKLLLDLGMRKGELLGLKIEDINFGEDTVFVARRPDDPEDKRKRQPQAKTEERILAMSPSLATLLNQYLAARYVLGNAKKHPFVIVGQVGKPLELNSVDFIFKTLREAFPALEPLSAHLLRHTWNDRYSELVEGIMSSAEEEKIRNYLMGWSDNSKTAQNYTKRFVEKRGRELSLQMQNATYREHV